MMIIILIFVFDPLAILLIIAANMTFLGLTKRDESDTMVIVPVEVDEPKAPTEALKQVVRKAKNNRKKKPKAPTPEVPDFFKFEKHGSTHDIPMPDPPRRNARGQIIVDEKNIRRM
jgi:hypothetical protein